MKNFMDKEAGKLLSNNNSSVTLAGAVGDIASVESTFDTTPTVLMMAVVCGVAAGTVAAAVVTTQPAVIARGLGLANLAAKKIRNWF